MVSKTGSQSVLWIGYGFGSWWLACRQRLDTAQPIQRESMQEVTGRTL